VTEGPHRELVAGGTLLRLPLVHEDEALGCFESSFRRAATSAWRTTCWSWWRRCSPPVLAANELSQDLASEVALRTRELEAQRNFAARIIDSLPVGLYAIDRGYRIRAWNRKREAGTQGVSREDALGRDVFEVLDRQPRELLKREFDRVFTTGEIQTVEMDSQATGESRHYRITKFRCGRTVKTFRTSSRSARMSPPGVRRSSASRKVRSSPPSASWRQGHARDQQSARDDPRL